MNNQISNQAETFGCPTWRVTTIFASRFLKLRWNEISTVNEVLSIVAL
jgi:hypothetical protein